MSISDAYDQWRSHNAKQEAWLERQPTCCHCNKKIQDEDLFDINGDLYHEDCARECFGRKTEDYE